MASRGHVITVRARGGPEYLVVLPIVLIALISLNLYAPFLPPPWGDRANQAVHEASASISKVVTFTEDATGRLRVEIAEAVNVTIEIARNPHIITVATVHTKGSVITGAELQATMRLVEVNFTAPVPNRQVGDDQTLFTWDFPLGSLPLGIVTLTAAIVLTVISCGSCNNATVSVPVDLQLTALARSGT